MRVPTHRPLEELDPTAQAFQFLPPHHVMHIIAGQPIGGGHEDTRKGGHFDGIPEMIQAWTSQGGATLASIAKHLLGLELFALGRQVSLQASERLIKSLGLALARRRDADIDGGAHQLPPSVGEERAAALRLEGTR